MRQTQDGGYIVMGTTSSFGAGSIDVWLIKVDATGNEEWNRTIGESGAEKGFSLCLTADGGYVVTGRKGGFIDAEALLIRISADSS